MCTQLFSGRSEAVILAIAALQMVFHSALVIGFIVAQLCLDNPPYNELVSDDIFPFIAAVNGFSLLLAVLLCIIIAIKKYELLHLYIRVKVFDMLLNNCVLLTFFIYYTMVTKEYMTLAACLLPFIFAYWTSKFIAFIYDFYSSKMEQELFIAPEKSNISRDVFLEDVCQKDFTRECKKEFTSYTMHIKY